MAQYRCGTGNPSDGAVAGLTVTPSSSGAVSDGSGSSIEGEPRAAAIGSTFRVVSASIVARLARPINAVRFWFPRERIVQLVLTHARS
jgi:hypothetical protein